MQQKSAKKNYLFKAGLYIILTLGLLIFSILWLRFFSLTPDKTITAKFSESGPITKGIPVFYHGVNIGKVDKVDFSDDFRYTMIKLLIYRKMTLPDNVYAEIKTEGLTGQKYIEILYPEKPSGEILKDGDVIEGRLTAFNEIIKAVSQAVKDGQIEKVFGTFKKTAVNASEASKKTVHLLNVVENILISNRGDIRTFVSEAASGAGNINVASASIRSITTSTELQENIRSTASYIPQSSTKLNTITANISKIAVDIDRVTGNPEFQEDLLKTVNSAGNITQRLDTGDLNCSIKKILEDTDKIINRYDCIGESFSEMMGERYLLMRLMFGKPGESFEKCTNLKCFEQEELYKSNICPFSCPNYIPPTRGQGCR